jgi:hypothetical protein
MIFKLINIINKIMKILNEYHFILTRVINKKFLT